MIQKYQSFNQLIGAAKGGFVDMAIVEYRGRDVKCIWGHTMDTFVPKEDGILCLYNEEEFKVFACFAGTKTEIKEIDRIQLINATGHDLHIMDMHGNCIRLILAAGDGGLIQMQERTLECPLLDGIKTQKKEYTKQGKIPQKQEMFITLFLGLLKRITQTEQISCVQMILFMMKKANPQVADH